MGKQIYRVSVQVSENGYNLLTVQEFLKLSIDERADLQTNNKVKYLDDEGNPLPLRDAIMEIGRLKNDWRGVAGLSFA